MSSWLTKFGTEFRLSDNTSAKHFIHLEILGGMKLPNLFFPEKWQIPTFFGWTCEHTLCFSKKVSVNAHSDLLFILLQIFQYLDFQDLLQCAEVCCSWKSIIQSNTLWSQVSTEEPLHVFISYSMLHFNITEKHVLQFLFFSDKFFRGERLDNRQYHEEIPAELPHFSHPSQPTGMHISKVAQLKLHQWVLLISWYFSLLFLNTPLQNIYVSLMFFVTVENILIDFAEKKKTNKMQIWK